MSSYNHFGCSCCGGPFNGGNCPSCSSVGSGNEFVYDPNPYSYNETPNFFNQPPQHQYETYSCEFCGGNSHPGFDCQTGNTPVFDQVQAEQEESAAQSFLLNWNFPMAGDDEYTVIYRKPKAITPDLPIEEPDNSLSMGDEHLNTILEMEKSSVENLIPIPSEFKGC
ncbi:hypothetical protein Tco_0837128 [Tanacetum coccineum]